MNEQPLFNFLIDEHLMEPFYLLLIGMNGVGKSFTTKKILEIMAKKEPRALVIASDREDDTWDHLPEFPVEAILQEHTGLYLYQINDLNKGSLSRKREVFMYQFGMQLAKMSEAYKIFIDADQRILFEAIIHPRYGLKNATLVASDFKQYLGGHHEDRLVMQLLGKRRFWDLNLIFECHAPGEIPNYMMGKNPLPIIWATVGSNFDRSSSKFDDKVFELMAAAKERADAAYLKGKETGNLRLRGYCEPIVLQRETEAV